MIKRSLVFVTSNPHKSIEVANALRPYDISVKHHNVDIPEIQGDTIEQVVRDKVEQAYKIVKKPVIVDDAGIFFKGYKHFPGIYSRFIISALDFEGIFKLIKSGHKAYFVSYIAYKAAARSRPILFSGRCQGSLVNKIGGKRKNRMLYDNIFIPQGDDRTFAQMTTDEKQQYDHRSKAIKKFARYLSKPSI